MSFSILDAEKPAYVHPFPLYVAEALQDVFGERSLHSFRHYPSLAQWPRENIVIVDSVLELLHEPDGLALNDLASSEWGIGEDEIHVAPITGIGPDDEPIGEWVCMRDHTTVEERQRLLVVVVL